VLQLSFAAVPVVTVPGVAFSVTVGSGYTTVTSTEAFDVPPGPVQARSNVVVPVSAEDVSEPEGGRLPVHPLDAAQSVAFVLVHESAAVPFGATLVGFAVSVAVGAGGGVTATVTELLASPPAPEQVNAKVLEAVRAGVDSVPDVARLPVQVPDAVQDVAFVLVHVSFAAPPYASVAESTLSCTVGAGGGGAEATTVAVFESLTVPPVPVQLRVKVVFAESALLIMLPLIDCPPDQPPDALHELAFVLVHDS